MADVSRPATQPFETTMAQVFRRNLRRDYRRRMPQLTVCLDGDATYSTRNWSLGGMALSGFSERLEIGTDVAGQLRPALYGGPWMGFAARVVRIEIPVLIALQFTELSPSAFTFLERLWRHPPLRGNGNSEI